MDKGIIKTVCLENNPNMVKFAKTQHNFSASIRCLISMYIDKHGIEDVDYAFRNHQTESMKKEILRLQEEVAMLRKKDAKPVVSTSSSSSISKTDDPTDTLTRAQDVKPDAETIDDIPEGYL